MGSARGIVLAPLMLHEVCFVFAQILGMPIVIRLVEGRAIPRQILVIVLQRIRALLQPSMFFAFRLRHSASITVRW